MSKLVMLVEDELFVAFNLQDIIEEAGHVVDGPFVSVAQAKSTLLAKRPDCALLDVQLKDGEVFPVADRLLELGVPLIFHSGHANTTELIARYPGAIVVSKPCSSSTLQAALQQAMKSA